MKRLFYLISAPLLVLGCGEPGGKEHLQNHQASEAIVERNAEMSSPGQSIQPDSLFSLTDAEQILGEPARLKDSTTTINKGIWTYNSVYEATFKDTPTGGTGTVYFMLERYNSEESASRSFAFIKTANESHKGVNPLQGLGNEAYFQSDRQNFYFILVRKGRSMFRMKVNKITGNTSLEGFNRKAKDIALAL